MQVISCLRAVFVLCAFSAACMKTIWVPTKREGNESNKARQSCDRGRDVANEWEGSFCLNKYIGYVLQLQLPIAPPY